MKTPIHDFLLQYAEKNIVRAHMPGHKGILYPYDITEVKGAGNLYTLNNDIICQSESNASALFGTKHTLYSAGGSTLAIQAMLAVIKMNNKGRKITILAHKNSHISLINAAILLDTDIHWSDSYDELESRINSKYAAVFVTNIDYLGNTCGIPKICDTAKAHNVPVIADNAHGAYLVFTNEHPIKQGVAMCADSAHKTLPALTGGAYLHIAHNADCDYAKAKSAMSLFGSTSPSYLILDSLDLCNLHIEQDRENAKEIFMYIEETKTRLRNAGYRLSGDKMRITIHTHEYGYNGNAYAQVLRENNIECEYSDDEYVVLLFSTATTQQDLETAANTLLTTAMREMKPKSVKELIPEKKENEKELKITENAGAAYFKGIFDVKTNEARVQLKV